MNRKYLKLSTRKNNVLLIFLVSLFFANAKEMYASEDLSGNNLVSDIKVENILETPITELRIGEVGKLYYSFAIPKDMKLSTENALIVKFPKGIKSYYNENIFIYCEDKKVGEIESINTQSDEFTIRFIEEVEPNSVITTEAISIYLDKELKIGNSKLNFGNKVIKEFKILPQVTGIGEIADDYSTMRANTAVSSSEQWEENWIIDANMMGDYFVGINDLKGIAEKHSNKEIKLVKEAIPYYAFFFDPENTKLYKHDRIARCIDMNHTISNGQATSNYKMSDIVEDEGVEKIMINTQSSIMLAKQQGMVFSERSTADYPLQFADKDTQESYNQKIYMFASQLMGWVDILKYSKVPELKLENYEYSDMQVKSRVSKQKEYEATEIGNYIDEIEATSNLFRQTDYLTDYQSISILTGESMIINIPEEQKQFLHYIDKEESKNLHMLEGIAENDFENFDSLTITANQLFHDESVELVIKKDFYDSQHIINEATGTKTNQYKQVLGITDEYIKKEVITIKSKDNSIDSEVVEDESTDATDSEVVEDESTDATDSEVVEDESMDIVGSEVVEDESMDIVGSEVVEDESMDIVSSEVVEEDFMDAVDSEMIEAGEKATQLPETGESVNQWYILGGMFILMGSYFVVKLSAVSNARD